MEETDRVTTFTTWLTQQGGSIHSDVVFQEVSSGFSVVAKSSIPKNVAIVSCPFSNVITPQLALTALIALCRQADFLQKWSERQLVCAYISMHWLFERLSAPPELAHGSYIAMLPNPSQLRTSTYFTEDELAAFQGSNLYGATIERLNLWEKEWQNCVTDLRLANPSLADRYEFAHYQRAVTYLTSRAFPSTLLSDEPSLISRSDSYPVLIPGVDSLNHARGQPVSWVISHSPSAQSIKKTAEPSISLVLHIETAAGAELFNNYGQKPNSELILGYGFTLPNNPDDTIVLKIGGPQGPGYTERPKWEVGREARGVEPVWEAVKAAVKAQDQSGSDEGDAEDEVQDAGPYEEELWATEALTEMAESLLTRLPSSAANLKQVGKMRSEVATMLEHYIEGQRDILKSIVKFAQDKEQSIVERAREAGIELV